MMDILRNFSTQDYEIESSLKCYFIVSYYDANLLLLSSLLIKVICVTIVLKLNFEAFEIYWILSFLLPNLMPFMVIFLSTCQAIFILICAIISYFWIIIDFLILWKQFKNLRRREIFEESVLPTIQGA